MNTDLDISWIQEQDRLHTIQTNYCREPMLNIDLYSIYINRSLYIDKILCEKQTLDPSGSLSKELVLQLIQNKKSKISGSKYKLLDILSYQVDIEPEHIQAFSKNEMTIGSDGFLKTASVLNDIHIPESIFIFHGINALYFIFQEIDTGSHRHTIKSILKTGSEITKHASTKKVRVQLEPSIFGSVKIKNRSTRRILPVHKPKLTIIDNRIVAKTIS